MNSLLGELRQRNVLRVGAAYLVVSWLILQFVEVVFPMLGLDENELGRAILIVLLIGLPIALALAWFFEITPEGIKRDEDIDRSQPRPAAGRRFDRIVIVVLMIAVGLLLADRLLLSGDTVNQPLTTTSAKSIAVLPFVNIGSEEDTGYFADGLTESLLHLLAQVPELRVPARTSVFAFRDSARDIRDIAESLSVETVLEGSVRRSGDQIRITAQLVQADTGFHLWSKTYDRDFEDIFVVQDEIAETVAKALQVTLLGRTDTRESKTSLIATKNAKAYELYLQALEHKNESSYSSLPRAEGLFKEALAIDPSFSEAKVDLALTYFLQSETGLITQDALTTRARPLLEQVLYIDPDHARALAYLAVLNWQSLMLTVGPVSEETQEAEQAMIETTDLTPNVPALFASLSNSARMAGRDDEALVWLEKGLRIDPLSPRLHLQRGRLLLGALDRPVEAEKAFAEARERAPGWTALDLASGDAAFAQDKFVEGMQWYLSAMLKDPQDHEIPALIGRHLYGFNLMEKGDEMLNRARAIAPDAPFTRALELERHVKLGNQERVVNLASSILRDDIEDRGAAFSMSVFAYVDAMIRQGQPQQVAAFFEELRPGISAVDYPTPGLKEFTMRFGLVFALNALGDDARSNAIGSSLIEYADQASPGWRLNDQLMANVALATGDIDTAVDRAVTDLSRPLGRNMVWRRAYQYFSWYEPLLKNEQVRDEISRLERRTNLVATEILASLDAG